MTETTFPPERSEQPGAEIRDLLEQDEIRKAKLEGALDRHQVFWEAWHARTASEQAVPRIRSLEEDYNIFRRAVRLLRSWNRRTMTGVMLPGEALPANPVNSYVLTAAVPVAAELRARWGQPGPEPTGRDRGDALEIGVTEIPLPEAINTFASGLGAALLSAASCSGVVHFTVHANHRGWRVQRTDRYWYNPMAFGARLTTPVDDQLYPADYRFGGDQSGGVILWDGAIHTVSAARTSTRVTAF